MFCVRNVKANRRHSSVYSPIMAETGQVRHLHPAYASALAQTLVRCGNGCTLHASTEIPTLTLLPHRQDAHSLYSDVASC